MPPKEELLVLPLTVQSVSVIVVMVVDGPLFQRPPPYFARLSLNVQLVSVAEAPKLPKPPPAPPAELPLTVQLVSVVGPSPARPEPPPPVELPLTVQSVSVVVARSRLIPPQLLSAVLSLMVQLLNVIGPLLLMPPPLSAAELPLKVQSESAIVPLFDSLDLLGRALNDAGDPAGAEVVLRQAQQRHPRDIWINYDLARSLEKLPRREEAIRYYAAARSLRPETAHELAHAVGNKGERDEEIAIFEDLKKLRPTSGRHLGCLGRALHNQGRLPEAAAILEAAAAAGREAVHKRPDDAYAHFSLGFALFVQGKSDAAIAVDAPRWPWPSTAPDTGPSRSH
jgi:Flp pilus assembly protein TadD